MNQFDVYIRSIDKTYSSLTNFTAYRVNNDFIYDLYLDGIISSYTYHYLDRYNANKYICGGSHEK